MNIKLGLLLCISLLISTTSHACFCAEHHRKYLMGAIGDTLIVFQTHLNRSDYTDPKINSFQEPQPYWFGDIAIGFYLLDTFLRQQTISSITIYPDQDYDEMIHSFFQKELQSLSSNPNFHKAIPIDMMYCDFQTQCSDALLLSDDATESISISFQNRKYPIRDIKDSISPLFNLYFYHHYDYKIVKNKLRINSLRKYKIGLKSIAIIHLASGSALEGRESESVYPTAPRTFSPPVLNRFLDLNVSIYSEPVLTHGKGYDWMFVL